jgi:hypothetical protein
MVPAGTERCPACGARVQPRVMDEETGFTWADFYNYSLTTIIFGLIAVFVPLLIVLACVYFFLLS